MAILVTTTGTLSPVRLADLSGRRLFHPTVDLDISLEFFLDEIRESLSLQSAIGAGHVVVTDEFGNVITNLLNIGQSPVSNFSAGTVSASTYYSGSTPLSDVFVNEVLSGTNINIGGSLTFPVVNLDDDITLSSVSATTISATTLFSGTTDLSDIFQPLHDVDHTELQDGINTFTAGTSNAPSVNITGGTFDNLTVSGQTNLNTVSANTLSANTIFSGGTDLGDIFATQISMASDMTKVQDGSNTFTGGTVGFPTVNVTALTIDHLTVSGDTVLDNLTAATITADNLTVTGQTNLDTVSANTLSANTIVSGSTDLGDIFITQTQAAADLSSKYDKTGGTITGNVVVTGNVEILGTATTLNTQVVQSQDNNILLNFSGNHITALGGGVTVLSGQADGSQSDFITDSDGNWNSNVDIYAPVVSASTVFGAILSGNTIFSGGSNLQDIFVNEVQAGTNIDVTGTLTHPVVNLDDDIILSSVSAATVSASTIFSGTTDLSDIFQPLHDVDHTELQDGINTFTAGTANAPSVNITGGTFDNLTVTGDTVLENLTAATITADNLTVTGQTNLNTVSANTLSASTIFSGGTNLGDIFITQNQAAADLSAKYDKSGGTISGDVTITGELNVLGSATTLNTQTVQSEDNNIELNFSGTHVSAIGGGITVISGQTDGSPSTIVTDADGNWCIEPAAKSSVVSGNTIFSGTAELSTLLVNGVENGTNITIGGTSINPIVNLNNDIVLGSVSATSISASTYFSGTTPLEQIIINLTDSRDDQTFIQNGINTFTGGTPSLPTVNITGGTFDSLTVTGQTNLNTVSANTLSANTIFSGGTDLGDIFATQVQVSSDMTKVQDGSNTFTGGTVGFPTVNVTGLTIDNITVSGESSFQTLSATSYVSGSTKLEDIFQLAGADTEHTRVQPGINITTGGTPSLPVVNLDSDIVLSSVSATTISASTLFSGSTDLSDIFQPLHDVDHTELKNGINTFTAGTSNAPSVNITGGTFDNITVSGEASFQTLSATTFISGSTDVGDLIDGLQTQINTNSADLTTKYDKTGGTISGDVTITGELNVLGSATTLNTQIVQSEDNNIDLNFSGTHVTAIGGGITVISGQTDGSSSTILTDADGNWCVEPAMKSSVVSGTSIFSGSTDLSDIFRTATNVGGDEGWFKGTSGVNGENLEFRSISAGTNISLTETVDEVAVNLNNDITIGSLSALTMSATTFILDGKGIGDSTFKAHGEAYIADNLTTSTNIPGAGNKEALVNALSGDTFAGNNNDFTVSAVTITQDSETNTGPRLIYTGITAQKFHVTTTITGVGSAGQKTYQFYIKKNGVKQNNLTMGTGFSSDPLGVAINGIVELTANDYLELWIFQTAGNDIRIEWMNITAVQI